MEKAVFLCIDTIIASSSIVNVSSMPVTIDIEHETQRISHSVLIKRNNLAQSLKIKTCLGNPKKTVVIEVSIANYPILESEVDIQTNVIGALNTTDEISLTLIFRVINSSKETIALHGVRQFRLGDFEFVKKLGVGSFGEVFHVVDSSEQSHALKVMKKQIDITNEDDDCIREIIPFLAFPKHPCLIGLEGFVYDRNRGVILVLEFASRGIISSIGFNELSIETKLKILYGLSSCVAFLHDHGFIHRDIHPSNVLVSDNYETKLIDFGVSRFFREEMSECVGHQGYQSPEIINSSDYDPLVDEFSLGVLLEHLNSEELFIQILVFFLKDEDPITRISCTEICTLIESGMFYTNTYENENYFSYLSKYHQSQPLRDSTIFKFVYIGVFRLENTIIVDFIILAREINPLFELHFLYFVYTFMDGVAFDTEIISYLDIFNYVIDINFSKDKFDLIYNYYLDNSPSEQFFNYRLFMMFHSFDYYSQYLNKLKDQDIFDVIDIMVDTIEDEICYKIMIKPFLFQAHVRSNQEIVMYFVTKALDNDRISIDKVLKYLKKEFSAGSIEACLEYSRLLLFYLENLEDENNYIKRLGKKLAKFAIQAKNYTGAYILYKFYKTKNNYRKAFKYLKIYAENGDNPKYLYKTAVQYLSGLLIEQDIETGVKLLRAGADLGDSQFQVVLAFLNFYGLYIPRNYDQAFWYNSLAMKQNNFDGLCLHGFFYFYGLSFVEQDIVKAREIFENCLVYYKVYQNEIWFINSSVSLVIIHALGLGVEINIERANEYIKNMEANLSIYEITRHFRIIEYFPIEESYLVEEESRYLISNHELLSKLSMAFINIYEPSDQKYYFGILIFKKYMKLVNAHD